jgi:uncharacterized protein
MSNLPEIVSQAWEARKGPVVLATVDAQGVPNIIYATCVKKYSADQLVIADNYFNKTRANILAGSQGSLLFITEAGKAYQVKGRLEYMTAGDIFADMKCWNDPKHPGNAAVVLHVEQVFSGGTQLL